MAFRLTIENLETGEIRVNEEIKGLVGGFIQEDGFQAIAVAHQIDTVDLARMLFANARAVEGAMEDESVGDLMLAMALVKKEMDMEFEENEEE